MDQLNAITQFCENTEECQQKQICRYFDEVLNEDCGLCCVCQETETPKADKKNATLEARQVIQLQRQMYHLKDEIKLQDLALTYAGSKSKDIVQKKIVNCELHGASRKEFKTAKRCTAFVQYLVIKGFLYECVKSVGDRHTVFLREGNIHQLFESPNTVFFKILM